MDKVMDGWCARDDSGQEGTPQVAPVLLGPFNDAGTLYSRITTIDLLYLHRGPIVCNNRPPERKKKGLLYSSRLIGNVDDPRGSRVRSSTSLLLPHPPFLPRPGVRSLGSS